MNERAVNDVGLRPAARGATHLVRTLSVVSALAAVACNGAATESRDLQAASSADESNVSAIESAYRNMNGPDFNGGSLASRFVRLSTARGVGRDGKTYGAFQLKEPSLQATDASGKLAASAALAGMTVQAKDTLGAALSFRIDAVASHPTRADVLLYTISTVTSAGAYAPMCGTDGNGPVPAILLSGRWDLRQGVAGGGAKIVDADAATFACRGFAAAKCVEIEGYRPWAGYAAQHAACIRLLRADYCGNGTSYTQSGNAVNVIDNVGVQQDDQSWMPEAEWTPDGARCLTKGRFLQLQVLSKAGLLGVNGLPSCALSRLQADCTDHAHFNTGSTLMSEVPLTLFVNGLSIVVQ